MKNVPQGKEYILAAVALDGGSTPYKMQNCGAFTGVGIMMGAVYGTPDLDRKSNTAKEAILAVYKKFEQEYGDIICKNVREKSKEDCNSVVANACKWAVEVIEDFNKK